MNAAFFAKCPCSFGCVAGGSGILCAHTNLVRHIQSNTTQTAHNVRANRSKLSKSRKMFKRLIFATTWALLRHTRVVYLLYAIFIGRVSLLFLAPDQSEVFSKQPFPSPQQTMSPRNHLNAAHWTLFQIYLIIAYTHTHTSANGFIEHFRWQ